MVGIDPDYAQQDLLEAIESKRYPSWTLYMQIITDEDIYKHFTYNPFDATKVIEGLISFTNNDLTITFSSSSYIAHSFGLYKNFLW